MKAAIKRKPLLEALSRAANIAPPRSVSPMLRTVLVQAGDGRITLTAYDLTQGLVEHVVGAEVPEPGAVALPSKELHTLVGSLSGDNVRIVVKDDRADVSDEKKRRFRLTGLPALDYPNIPVPSESAMTFTLAAAELGRAVGRVRHAFSTDSSRMHLHGVNVEIKDGLICAVATDGYRLAVHGARLIEGEPDHTLLIPGPATESVEVLCALAGREDVTLAWERDARRVVWVTHGARRAAFSLPNAEYPPWRQGMQEPGPSRVRINATILSDVVQAICSADTSREHAVHLAWQEGRLQMAVDADDQGSHGEDSLAAETVGESASVHVSPRYLLEALKAAGGDVLLCTGPRASEGMDPLIVRTDDGYHEMVMPMVVK